jgi:hypothetical protein
MLQRLSSSLFEQFYQGQTNGFHFTDLSLYCGTPLLNFLYLQTQSVLQGISHKCRTIPLSSGGLTFQAEIATDPKTYTIFFRTDNKRKNENIHLILLSSLALLISILYQQNAVHLFSEQNVQQI